MTVEHFVVGPLATNCYLLKSETSGEAVVIDPGGVTGELMRALERVDLAAVILTHGHFDHIQGVEEIVAGTGAPVMIHELDASMLTDPVLNGSFMIGVDVKAPEASGFLAEGDEVSVGESMLRVLHTPGHTPGGISLVYRDRFVICGDTLFRLSVGRWDLPGGDYGTLVETLRSTFLALPDAMEVYPGHGEATTIGYERKYNQFMRA